MNVTGLEPSNEPLPPPTPCTTGSNPAAGVLQFSAATYAVSEQPLSGLSGIEVTRTQGSTGAVSATVTTGGGTAAPGVHYWPLSTTVYFADGDTTPRTVPLDIIGNNEEEPDRTVNLSMSALGGCATLGAQSSAVVTILDEDTVVTPTLFTVGGTVNGLIGTLVLEDHHGLFLQIFDDGPFTFSDLPTPSGMPYSVRVFNQPHDPIQVCTVTNGTGVFTDHNVTDVLVTCVGQ
jgi:Calx-beta domain